MDNHQLALKHLAKADPVMAKVIKRAKLEALEPRKNYFQSLIRSIISQQLSTKAAASILNKYQVLFGSKTPKPADVLKMPDKKLRGVGLSYGKISYLKNLARAIEQGDISFRKFNRMTDEEIIEQLIKIKGIGRWTAEMFLIFSMNRPNVFSHGDLGLRNAVKKLYRIDPKLHHRKLKKLLNAWHPHKSTASRHLWASLRLDKNRQIGENMV